MAPTVAVLATLDTKGTEAAFRRITRYDREQGSSVHRATVAGQWVGEPVFVPRSADAAEDDGFVLALLFDGEQDRSAISHRFCVLVVIAAAAPVRCHPLII